MKSKPGSERWNIFKAKETKCPVPNCPVSHEPQADPDCMCGKPLLICIPAGQHYHPCKVHPENFVRGSDVTL